LDLRIGYRFAADVALSMPAKRLHLALRFLADVSDSAGSYCFRVCSASIAAGVIFAIAD
jgi:hypothetical protein